MGADHDVYFSSFDSRHDRFLFFGQDETAEHPDGHRKGGEPFFESLEMLVSKNGCRRQHCYLFSIGNRFERGPHGHFGFAVTDVSANQAVHRQRRFHVTLDVSDRCQLIGRLIVGKRLFEFFLPFGIRRKRVPGGDLPLRVQFQQLLRHIANGPLSAGLPRNPGGAAEFVQLRFCTFGGGIFLDEIQALERHEQAIAALIKKHHAFLFMNEREAVV